MISKLHLTFSCAFYCFIQWYLLYSIYLVSIGDGTVPFMLSLGLLTVSGQLCLSICGK